MIKKCRRVGTPAFKPKAVFYAAVLAEIIVCILGFNDVVAYLWLNVVACLSVVIIAYVLQMLMKEKAAGEMPAA